MLSARSGSRHLRASCSNADGSHPEGTDELHDLGWNQFASHEFPSAVATAARCDVARALLRQRVPSLAGSIGRGTRRFEAHTFCGASCTKHAPDETMLALGERFAAAPSEW